MTMVIAIVAFWGYLSIKTTGDDHKDSIRAIEKVIDKVNMEWGRERVDGHWRVGKDAGWLELDVSQKYTQRN